MPLTDDDLMRRVQQGDTDAFAELVERHKSGLVNYMTHVAGSRERAEDLSQEAFLRAFTHADRYVGEGRFSAWLYRIATNLAYSESRRRRRWGERVDRVRRWLGMEERRGPDLQVQGSHEQLMMQEALTRLPESFRAAVVLREIEGWSYADVAEALGVPEGTVKSRVNRGKAMLRKDLAAWWGEVDHV
jgi:RNA polymerase sigma-70 factor (ECF subfamily)